jgi:hypothetical protein
LFLEIQVTDEDGNEIDNSHPDWEDRQDVILAKAIDAMQDALDELDFNANVSDQ